MPVRTPINVNFGTDEMKNLEEFTFNNLTSLKGSYAKLHEEKVPKWRRLYKGTPAEETKDFPWPNASNVVIQLIGENVDILKAGIIGSIYEIFPLWTTGLIGEWPAEEQAEEQRAAIEGYMNLMGLEPNELDLYRVESLAATDMIKLGTVVIKMPWETQTEALVTGDAQEGRGIPASTTLVKYDGPRPEKLAFEDWAATPTSNTLEGADFKYHKYTVNKQQLEEKIQLGLFASPDREIQKKIDDLIDSPDREGLDTVKTEQLKNENVEQPQPTKEMAQWDIYECWFVYWHNKTKYRLIYIYHLDKRIPLRVVFNYYPDNEEPFEMGRLGFTEDGLLGFGFAEMLEYYQEEVSTGHNQRVDNRTLGNTSIVLAGRNGKLDAGFSLYPMAVLPFSPDEVDIRQLGANYPSSVQEETLTIELAKARAGVDGGMSGAGSGVTNPKKGNYSAMGTFALLQAGNRRININVTDFRYMHLKSGRKMLKQYAEFGVGDRLQRFGTQAQLIKKALESIKKKRIDLPIRAATASMNQEVEKQNGMLFTQVMQRHYSAISQILQGVQNPTMPEDLKQYLIGSIGGMAQLMSRLLRVFGYDDVSRLQPELEIVKKLREQAAQAKMMQQQQLRQQQGANGNGQQSLPAIAGEIPQAAAGLQSVS